MRNVHTSFWIFILSIGSMVVSAVAKPNNNVLLLNPSVPVLDSLPALCQQAQPLNLLQFIRSGTGTFSGPGVFGNQFDPNLAGAGRHVITFQYFDSINQVNAVYRPSIWVHPLQVAVRLNGNCAPGTAIAVVDDSSAYGVQWFRNNQLIKDVPISYAFIGQALLTDLGYPYDMVVDAQGNRYIVQMHAQRVVRYATGQQTFTVVAGGNGQGSGLNQLHNPTGVALDAAGNVYVADHSNHRIVRWAPGDTVGVVVAGSALGINGTATNRLHHPYQLKFDGLGRLYVTDRDNHRVMRYPATVSTTTTALAGTVVVGAAGNGSANNQLSGPHALFIDSQGSRMYISDDNNARIMRYDLLASNVANSGTRVAGGNGHGVELNRFGNPIAGILVQGEDIYLADLHAERILRWKEGAISGQVIAGGLGYGSQLFRTSRPTAVRIDAQGNLEYLERDHARLVRFDANKINSDTLVFTEAGVYRAEFQRFGLNCVSTSTNFTINKPIAQITSSRGTTVCEGDTTSLSTPALAGYAYQWYKDGQSIAGANTNTYITSVPGSYTVETGDSSGCFHTSEPFIINALPQVTLTADGLCLGSQLTTNVPDSNVVRINWYRDNQLVKQANRMYEEDGEVVAGNFNGWIDGLPFHWGMGGFHMHNDGWIYFTDNHDRRVVKYNPATGQHQTVAGGNGSGNALNQLGDNPRGVFVTPNGDVYVADNTNHRVVRWSPGAISGVVVAGVSNTSGSQLSRLNEPWDVVVDDSGYVYVSDDYNHRVVRWAPGATSGVVVAGVTGQAGASLNQLTHPKGLYLFDGYLYVSDRHNHRIMRYALGSTTGVVVAGGNGAGSSLNQLNVPEGVYVNSNGDVYVADHGNSRVVRWSVGATEGVIVAGGNGNGSSLNQTEFPRDVNFQSDGALYVLTNNSRLMHFELDDTFMQDTLVAEEHGVYHFEMTTIQGCENNSQSHRIFAPEVLLSSSRGFDVCQGDTTQLSTIQNATYTYQWFRDGSQIAGATASSLTAFEPGLYHVAVLDSNACSRISESMRIWPKPVTTLSADGLCLGSQLTTNVPDSNVVQIDWFRNNQLVKQTNRKYKEEGEPVLGNFNGWINNLPFHWGMGDFHIHTDGSIYVYDIYERRVVRYYPSTGQFTVVAGGNGEGNALNQLNNAQGIFVTPNGDLFIADMGNHRVVRWAPGATQGVVVAGATGVATAALNRLNHPSDVFIDAAGNMFIADNHNHRVVRWAPGATAGVLVAGTSGQPGAGMNQLQHPHGVYISRTGQLFVSDNNNHRVMRYNLGSTAGVVVAGGNGAGSGLNQLTHPHHIYVDDFGDLYISDSQNHRIMRWRAGATSGELVVGGFGSGGGLNQVPHPGTVRLGNGRSLFVSMGGPRLTRFDLDVMPADTLYAEDAGNYHVNMKTLQGCENNSQSHRIFAPEVLLSSSRGFDVCQGDTTQLSTIQNATYTYQWYKDGLQIAGAASSGLTAFEPGLYHVEVLDSNACLRASESMRIWPKPITTLTADGLCLGSQLTTNVPDSNVVQIDWFRNNQLVKQTSRKYKEEGEPVLGNFNGWINNLPFHWGMGDFHIHTDGSIYFTDMHDRRVVRYFPSTGQFTVVAGGNGEGNALNQLSNPQGIFVTSNGDVFIADMNNHRVVRWAPGATQGVVVAGATSTAGTALNRLNHPSDVFIDPSGNMFIADNHNHRVVRWAPGATAGVLVAGTTGQSGGGASNMSHPTSIFIAADGGLYVADNHNHRVMLFTSGSTQGTVVAGGNWSGAELNQLTHPHDIYVDGSNNIYVTDNQNHRVVLWKPGATSGELIVGGFGSGGGLNQVPHPGAIKLANGRSLFVSINGPRLTRFDLDEMLADTLPITASGSYTTKFTTVLGCENISNTIEVPRLFGSDTIRVFGADTLLAGLNGGAYQQYLWSTGSTDSTLLVNATGMYQLTATDTLNGCSREQQIFVYLGRASVVASETEVCEGSLVQLSLQTSNLLQPFGMGQIRWSTGDSSLTINKPFNQTTSIGFEYIDGGFVHRDSITILVRVGPSGINLPDSISVCGDSVVLDPGFFDGYLWSTGDSTRELTVKKSGTYSVYVDSNDCSSYREVYVSLVKSQIVAESTTICQNESTILSAYSNQGYLEGFFDGNRYLRMPNPGPVGSSARTIMFWVKPKESTPMPFVSYGNMASGTSLLTLGMNVGVGNCPGADVGPSILSNSHFATYRRPINLEGWTHIAYVLGGSNASFEASKVYMNGVLISQGVHGTDFCGHNWGGWQYNTTSTPMDVGYSEFTGRAGTKFKGDLDELAIWNRNLTTSEIQLAMQQGPERVNNGLVNYYPFDDLQGDTLLRDIIGNNHGIVMGGAFSSQVVANYIGNGQRYLWSTGDTLPVINVTPRQTTTYSLTVSDGITACTDSVTILVRARPSGINLPDTISVCGDSVVLDPGVFDRYLWSTGDTTRDLVVKTRGNYWVQVDSNDCSSQKQIYVSLIQSKIIASDSVLCEGEALSLSSSGLPNYALRFDGINNSIQPDFQPDVTEANNFTIEFRAKVLGNGSATPYLMWASQGRPPLDVNLDAGVGIALSPNQITVHEHAAGYLPTLLSYNGVFTDYNHFILVYENKVPKLYINGQLVTIGTASQRRFVYPTLGVNYQGQNGGIGGGSYGHFNGEIDYFRIWSGAMDSSEVIGLNRSAIPLIGFEFNEGRGDSTQSHGLNAQKFSKNGTYWERTDDFFPLSYTWSTGDTLPVINVTPQQTTMYYLMVTDGVTTCTDSLEIFVNPVPVVNLASADSLTFCEGGSALLVADSVAGATYRWIQEDAVVSGLKVEVFSTHGGVGSNNDYPSSPSTRAEFDKFFDTTYQSTSLHYQGRHNALQSLSWSGMNALTNAGIAVPNNGDFFAVQVSGFFNPSETGIYRFNASSDDHMDLIIGDSLVLSSYVTRDGLIQLQAGQRVAFKARMQEYGGHESFNLRWEKPSQMNTANWQLDTLELNGSRGAIVLADTGKSIIADESGTYRAEVTTATGCTVSSNALQIEVLPLPVVTLSSFNPICLTDSVTIPLSGGWPVGGIFSGTAVSNGVFDPLVAGAGIHEISYTYTDSLGNGCTNTATQQMVVLPLAVNLQVDDYCAPSQAVASIADSSVYGVQWYRNNQLIQEKPISYEFTGEAMLTNLGYPYDMNVDAQGNRYIVEMHAHRIVKYAAGQQTFMVVAGGNGNGTELNQLHNPTGVAVDASGNVFVADHSNHRIVRWAPGATQGVVVAGSALGVHGSATNQLHNPYHLKFDNQGRLYVTDINNSRVMRYAATISTTTSVMSGTVIVGSAGAGSANNQLSGPYALFIDIHTNRMYVSDDGNARIIRYDLSATNVANSGTRVAGGNGHGAGLNQFSHHIAGILVEGGEIYLADLHGSRIMRWREGASSGQVIAGGNGYGPQLFRTSRPTAVRIDAQGNLEYLERDHARLVRFDANKLNTDTLSFTEAGVYRAEFKRFGLNCVSTSTDFTINKPIAQISSSKGSTVCEGDTTTLSTPALAGYAYQWYKDGQSIAGANTNTYITSVPGSYTVETGDSSGCFFTSEPFVIHAKPQVNLTADGLCLGSLLQVSTTDSNVVGFDWLQNGSVVKQVRAGFEEAGEPFVAANTGNTFGLNQPFDLATDHLGNIYYSEHGNHRVVRRAPDGSSPLVVAGNGIAGSGLSALDRPTGIFVDAALNVYVADMGNHRVVKWAPGATQGELVAGTTGVAGSTLARLNEPMDVVVDDSGAVYVADKNNHRVVRWMPNATSGTLFAGTGTSGTSINQLNEPYGLAIWKGGVYIADHWNSRVIRVFNGINTVVATNLPNGDQRISSVHVDKIGAIYLSELFNNRVVRWFPGASTGEVVAGGNANGNAANQLGQQIYGITTDLQGNLYVADGIWNQRIMKYNRVIIETDSFVPTTSGSYGLMTHTVQGCSYQHSAALQILSPEVNLTSSAGLDVCEGDTTSLSTIQDSTYTFKWFRNGAQIAGATASSLTAFEPGLYHVEVLDSNACSRTSESMRIWPKPVATLTANGLCLGSQLTTNVPDSNVVQIDWFRNNQLVKQVSRKYLSEGQPVLGNFNGWINNIPFHWGMGDFHIHTDGSIYISDMHDRRVVRYFPSTGQFTVVAGGNGSGNALNQLDNPQGVFVTSNGDVYVADYGNHRVVRWSPGATAGVVVAGATGQAGSALNRLHGPLDVFVDQIGQMFIADEQNHRVMRWAPNATSGVLVAGSTGQVGSALNQLHSPVRVFVSNSGLLYVSDISNNRVMRYAPGSSTGTVVAGGNGAGIGLQQLNTPIGIFVDQTEALYIADLQNNRVVKWNNGATAGQVVSNNDSLSTPNQVNQPRSVAIGPNKELYVVSNSQLLLKFGFDAMTSDLLVPENAGSYFVKMLTKQGCENSSMPSIISSPDVNLQSSLGFDVCEGDTTQLSTIQNATYTYRWLKDGIQVAGATNSFINVSQPGMYQVEVTDSNNCSRSSEALRVWPKPIVSLTADGVCLGSELLTNTPDSQVVQIDWYRNNQLFRNTRANFKANGSAHLGYFSGLWLRDIEFQGAGISDVHVHHDGAMYVLAQTNQFSGISVLKYTPNANAFVLVAGGNGFGSALNQIGGFGAASFGYGGLFVAENGDIYVADRTNHRVVKWTPGAAQGIVVAGGNGSGSALNQLSNPQSVFVNGSGDVFVVDQSNHRVVRWSIGANTGVVVAGGNGLGAGLNQFNNPRFVTATSNGDLYISDQNNHRVVRYAAGASTGVVVAGGNFSGTALNQLNQPNGIAVDKSGNVFVADRFNNRIVRWAPGSTSGEVVAGLNQGNTSGLDRTTRPVSLKLGSDYRLYVTSVDTVNGSINLNNSNRLMSFELNKLVADTLRAQQGGNYSVVFTNITGCSNQSQQLSVFDPQVNFPALANSCISDASRLLNTATPVGGTYFGLGVDTGYFHPSIAGVGSHMLYYLYTDSNGCSKLDSQTIQVVPEPVVSIDTLGSMNLCRGESVVLQSPLVTGQTYQWYRNGVLIPQATQHAFTVLDTVSALYHVMVTRNVCEKSSDTLEVVVRPKPVVTIANQGAATICQGDSVVLQAASDTDVTYQWYRNNQLLVGSTQSSLVANQSGSYTCQVIKANGCADTSNALSLTVLDFPIAQITPASATTVCAGQIVQLNANQGTGLTHRWFRNGVLIPGATSANYQATTSGDYTVEVKREQLCETLSQAVTVVVNPLPQISIAATQGNQFCSGDSILITAQSTAQVLRYAWFRNGQLTPSDSTANFYATLPGHYHARVFDSAGCDQASDSVLVGYFNPPFANEAICAISVDTLAGRNVVVWEKTAGVRTSSYNVYREGAISGQYNLIGNVPYDSLSIFIDTTANPLSQSFRYRIATVDSCGFVSAQSSVHRTIHLSSNIGVNNEVNLFWTTYEGVVVPTHRILRSINGGPFVEIASVSGTTFTYTDLTPPQGAKNYLIEIAIPGGCNPTGLRLGNLRTASSYSSIQSNKVAVGSGVSVINRSLAGLHTLYPNPSNGLLTLVRSEQQMGDQVFKIYDARGRLVKTIRFEDQSLVYQIDMVEAADGIYTIRANDSNWSARFVIAK